MKKHFITSIWLIIGLSLYSQQPAIEYTYDGAGNRTHREVIYIGEKKDNTKTGKTDNESDKLTWSEKIGEYEISIFPNPTKGELEVEITGIKDATATRMELFSTAGEMIFSSDKLKGQSRLDLSGRQAGTYVLKIILDNRVSTWKVVKE